MEIITNILKFEKTPFKDKVTVFEYRKKEEINFRKLGDVLLNLRKVPDNRRKIIIQFGDKIISTELLEDDFEKDLAVNLFPPTSRLVSAQNDDDLDLLKRIIGDAIAVNLRHSNKLWKIQETYNSIFEVSSPETIEGFGKIDVFPGFQYAPILLKNGEVGVIVDLKYKFHSSVSLREKLSYSSIEINPKNYYVDTCPIIQCPEKQDPFSNCRYAGTGKTVKLKKIVNKKPSEVIIDNLDIIEFHKQKFICPRAPVLGEFIQDEPPIALSFYKNDNDEYYSYPLERIRELPTFSHLDYHDRGALMKQIRPDPPIRFKRSQNYMRFIGNLTVGSITLNPIRNFQSWNSCNSGLLDLNNYIIGNSHRTDYPALEIQKYGIFDKGPEKLKISILLYREYNEYQLGLIKKPFLKETKEIIILQQFLSTEIEFDEIKLLEKKGDLSEYMDKFVNNNNCIIVVHSDNDSVDSEFKELVSGELIKNEYPHQGINFNVLKDKIESRQNGYFRNIFLGIIAKLGLHSWLLNVNENGFVKYIGLQSQNISLDATKYRGLLNSYYNSGRFSGGYYISDNVENRQQNFESAFKLLTKNNDEVVLIKNGKFYDRELKDIEHSLNILNLKHSIVEVISSSPLRIYSKNEKNRIFRPHIGTFYWISKTEVGLISTQGNVGTQNPIVLRNIKCDEERFEKLLYEIFDLCHCYSGWDRIETKLPVPIHSSSRGMGKIPKDMANFHFKKPWFI